MSYVRNVITNHIRTYGYSTVTFSVDKKTLLTLSEEERKFIEEFVTGYYRSSYRLRPKDMDAFLSSQKYEDSCHVHVSIPMEKLIERGILRVVNEGGLQYWYIYDEKLPPVESYSIYRTNPETLRTLIIELGLGDFLTAYDVKMSNDMFTLFYVESGGLSYSVSLWSRTPVARLEKVVRLIDVPKGGEPEVGNVIHVIIRVENPKVDDIPRMGRMYADLAEDAKRKVKSLLTWIGSYLDTGADSMNDAFVSGSIDVTNYAVKNYHISIEINRTVDDMTKFTARLIYTYPDTLEVMLRQSIGSEYLVRALHSLELGSISWSLEGSKDATFALDIDLFRRSTELTFNGRYRVDPGLLTLPDIAPAYEIVRNMKDVLREALFERVKKGEHERVYVSGTHSYTLDYSLKELFDTVGWRVGQSREEAVIKTWLVKVLAEGDSTRDVTIKPDVVATAYALAYLDGIPYSYLLEKVRSGFEYMVDLSRRGRLKISDKGVSIDGKPTGINVSDQHIREVLETVLLLTGEPEDTGALVRTKVTT